MVNPVAIVLVVVIDPTVTVAVVVRVWVREGVVVKVSNLLRHELLGDLLPVHCWTLATTVVVVPVVTAVSGLVIVVTHPAVRVHIVRVELPVPQLLKSEVASVMFLSITMSQLALVDPSQLVGL